MSCYEDPRRRLQPKEPFTTNAPRTAQGEALPEPKPAPEAPRPGTYREG